MLQELGPKTSKYLYNQLEPGEHPNYPDVIKDNTHFSEFGARKIALIVLNDIKAQKLEPNQIGGMAEFRSNYIRLNKKQL